MTDTEHRRAVSIHARLADTTIFRYPSAFINRRGEPVLIQLLDDKRRQQLVEMYLAFEPRNCFSGLPPITDAACIRWVEGVMASGVNLVALSFDKGLVGHAAIFDIGNETCEMLCVVSPSEQKVGIGTELTRNLIQLAHELGFETVKLNVEAGNHVARHVYEKCGFQYGSRGMIGELDMSLDLSRYHDTTDVPVGEVMCRRVVSARPNQSCRDALQTILRERVATLPVVDGQGRLVGILSEMDLLLPANLFKRVGEVLTREVVYVREGQPLGRTIPMFRASKLRCIPVVDRFDRLVGVLTRKDVLAHYVKRLGAELPAGGETEGRV